VAFPCRLRLLAPASPPSGAFPVLGAPPPTRDCLPCAASRPPPRLGSSSRRRGLSRPTLVSSRHRLAHLARPSGSRAGRRFRGPPAHQHAQVLPRSPACVHQCPPIARSHSSPALSR